jgi:hypothetical protein
MNEVACQTLNRRLVEKEKSVSTVKLFAFLMLVYAANIPFMIVGMGVFVYQKVSFKKR